MAPGVWAIVPVQAAVVDDVGASASPHRRNEKRVAARLSARSQHMLPSRTPYMVTPYVVIPTPWDRVPTNSNNTCTEAFGLNAMHTHAVAIHERT